MRLNLLCLRPAELIFVRRPLQHSFIAQSRAIVLTLLLGKPLSNNSSLPQTVLLDSCHLSKIRLCLIYKRHAKSDKSDYASYKHLIYISFFAGGREAARKTVGPCRQIQSAEEVPTAQVEFYLRTRLVEMQLKMCPFCHKVDTTNLMIVSQVD